MGCNEVPSTSNDPDDDRRKNLNEDISIHVQKSNTEENSDEKIDNFFSLDNEEEKISAFLVNTNSIPHNNKQSNKEILNYIISGKNIELYSEYEECKSISKFKSEFFIVSKNYMESKYKDFNEIKDKKIKIKKHKGEFKNPDEKKIIYFIENENGLYRFIEDFNFPSDIRLRAGNQNHYFYYIKFN